MVSVTQYLFPKPAAGGEERVISYEELIVVMAGREPGILEMAGHLSLIGAQTAGNNWLVLRLLTENGFANYTLDIGIRQLHRHSKTGLKPLQARRGVQRGLPSTDEKKALIQFGAAVLRDFL